MSNLYETLSIWRMGLGRWFGGANEISRAEKMGCLHQFGQRVFFRVWYKLIYWKYCVLFVFFSYFLMNFSRHWWIADKQRQNIIFIRNKSYFLKNEKKNCKYPDQVANLVSVSLRLCFCRCFSRSINSILSE